MAAEDEGAAADAAVELVLVVGLPAQGKSSFCRYVFPDYARINQDMEGSKSKCMKKAEALLLGGAAAAAAVSSSAAAGGRATAAGAGGGGGGGGGSSRPTSVIVDATNIDRATRADWVSLARRCGVPARALYFDSAGGASHAAGAGAGGGAGGTAEPVQDSLVLCKQWNELRKVNPLGGADGLQDQRAVPSMVLSVMRKNYQQPSTEEGFAAVQQLLPCLGPFDFRAPADAFAAFLGSCLVQG